MLSDTVRQAQAILFFSIHSNTTEMHHVLQFKLQL